MKKIITVLISIMLSILMLMVFASCEDDSSTEPVEEEVTIIADNVVVIDSTESIGLHEITDSTLVFTKLDTTNIVVGSVLVGGSSKKAKYGYLRKVKKIITTDGTVKYTTEEASISEVIKQGKMDFSTKLSYEDLDYVTGEESLKLTGFKNRDGLQLFKFKGSIGDSLNSTDKWKLMIDYSFSVDCSVDAEWELSTQPLKYFNFSTTTSGETDIRFRIQRNFLNWSWNNNNKPLKTLYFKPITIFIAGVPIVIVAKVDLNIKLTANGNISYTATFYHNEEVITEYVYTKDADGWEVIEHEPEVVSDGWEMDNSFYFKGNVKGTLGLESSLLLYGLVGPHVTIEFYVNPYIEALSYIKYGVKAGFRCFAGILIDDIYGFSGMNASVEFLNFKFLDEYNTLNSQVDCIIVSPGDGQQYVLGEQIELNTYVASQDNNEITSIGVTIIRNDNNICDENIEVVTGVTEYDFTYDIPESIDPGRYQIRVIAQNKVGQKTEDTRFVDVLASHPPVCEITAPADGSLVRFGDIINVTVDATDSDGEIEKVSFYIGPVLLGYDDSAPYTVNYNTTLGALWGMFTNNETTIKAFAIDDTGVSSYSDEIVIRTTNPPHCSLESLDPTILYNAGTKITIAPTVYDDDNDLEEVRFYIDNQLVTTLSQAPYLYEWNTTTEDIGSHPVYVEAEDSYGTITQSEVVEVRVVEVQNTPPTNGLVAYYPFDNNINDESGNGNHGSEISGNISYGTGVNGNAVKFGGYYDPGHIKVANHQTLQFEDEVSLVYWVKIDELGAMDGWGSYVNHYGGGCIIAKDHDRSGFYTKVSSKENGEFSTFLTNNSYTSPKFSISNNSYTYNNFGDWIQIAIVINNNIANIYINGQLDTTETVEVDFSIANSKDLYFGKYYDGWYPFNGFIDEVRIYKRALNSIEIISIYEYDILN